MTADVHLLLLYTYSIWSIFRIPKGTSTNTDASTECCTRHDSPHGQVRSLLLFLFLFGVFFFFGFLTVFFFFLSNANQLSAVA